MSSLATSLIVLACVFGGALVGMLLRATLPEHHLSPASRDLMKLGMGTIATMTALVLGLLVASAKGSYDTQSRELTEMSAKIVILDRFLGHYGSETKEARELLRKSVAGALDRIWPGDRSPPPQLEPTGGWGEIYDKIQELKPKDDAQRSLQTRALNMVVDLQTRLLIVEQQATPFSMPLLVAVGFWLTISFISYSLHASPNATLVATLFLCALSVSVAILLVLEMYTPFEGLIQISSAPLRNALAHLGQ